MQFRQKIEAAVLPLLNELLAEIAKLRTTDVLNHYQFRLNLSQLDKDKLPDGFWAKGRYVSALALASAFQDNPSAEAGPHSPGSMIWSNESTTPIASGPSTTRVNYPARKKSFSHDLV